MHWSKTQRSMEDLEEEEELQVMAEVQETAAFVRPSR